jgi:gluconate 2-dehydrogenase alpha chain
VPSWGPKFKEWLATGPKSVCGIYAQMEVLPYHANYLDLDPTKRDDLDDPCLRVTYDMYDNEKNMAAFLEEKINAIHRKMGATHIWTILKAPPTPVFSHVFGGTRMGADPATSVVNEYGFAHEVPNLQILGGSVFPSTSGRNPTETMQALSWRNAEYLARNFQRLAT